MGRLITKFDGIWYTHRMLWQIAEEQAQIARERERDWANFSLVAMTFAFHTVEAYVNVAGQHLAPEIWADEWNFFRKDPYRGWIGKLKKILELTDIPWQPDARPIKTILELQELRDAIAHGRSEPFSGTSEGNPDNDEAMQSIPNSKIRSAAFPKSRLDEVLDDVRDLVNRMHLAVAPKTDDPFLKATAIGGPAVWMNRSTTTE